MKNLLLFWALALCLNSYGQSKKEQIAALNYSMDSLNVVLSTTRNKAAKDIGGLNTTIEDLSKEISDLKRDLSELESSVSTLKKDKMILTSENEKFKTDLEEISKTNVELEAMVKILNNEIASKERDIAEMKNSTFTEKASDFKLNLIESNKRESPAARVSFIADYRIQLLYGDYIIAVFEDVGEGWLSDEKDNVWISTAAGSDRSYILKSNSIGEVKVTQTFFFDGTEENVWIKTYKNDSRWELMHCEGACE
jgi:regulator of replication initiation timing